MLFDKQHILYMVISALVTAGVMVIAYFFIKKEKGKEMLLRFFAIITVVLHFSSIYYDYFFEHIANPELELPMFIPLYPCNVCMWMLLIVALGKKDNKFIKLLSQFVALGGIICGIVGILVNENYGAFEPTQEITSALADFDILKGMLSHSTMLAGAIYLIVGGFVKIRVFDTVIGSIMGLLMFVADGFIVNRLIAIADMSPRNSMYLQEPPFESLPWINTLTIGILGVLIAFSVSALVEQIALPKEERWYSKINRKIKQIKESRAKGEKK